MLETQKETQAVDRSEEWVERAKTLKTLAEGLIEPFHRQGHTDLHVQLIPAGLKIFFGKRPYNGGSDYELGAEADFECFQGQVHCARIPFRSRSYGKGHKPFAVLGPPLSFSDDDFANAVADFLEWAAFGEGNNGEPLKLG